jgi:hypothetical protein
MVRPVVDFEVLDEASGRRASKLLKFDAGQFTFARVG